jgi:hypothetical protein
MQQIKQRFARHKDQWVANAKRAWQGAINAQSLNNLYVLQIVA